MNFTVLKQQTNGWGGLATITVKLQTTVYNDTKFYQVTEDMLGAYNVWTYRTLNNANKRYQKLVNKMTVKRG